MKHIDDYTMSGSTTVLTREQKVFLRNYLNGAYTINPITNLIDVNGHFVYDNSGYKITNFAGIKFGNVTGNFNCYNNELTSLEGAPRRVDGFFSCAYNNLTSLEGAPYHVGNTFYCYNNKLTNLKYAPKVIGFDFDCSENNITTLKDIKDIKVGKRLKLKTGNLEIMWNIEGKIGGLWDDPTLFETLFEDDITPLVDYYKGNEVKFISNVKEGFLPNEKFRTRIEKALGIDQELKDSISTFKEFGIL